MTGDRDGTRVSFVATLFGKGNRAMSDDATQCSNFPTHNESARLESLKACHVLDTANEAVYDALTDLAKTICGTSTALISLVDQNRVWFKSSVGFDEKERPRQTSFCTIGINKSGLFQVPNALNDPRFKDSPVVTGPQGVRFYCGVPLVDSQGHQLGMLCVLDRQPRRLSDLQCNALKQLACVVMYLLEQRRNDPKMLELAVMIERSRDAPSASHVENSRESRRASRRHADAMSQSGSAD